MEGSISAKPKNVIFIATSNRKNIVKETWSDREGADEVRRRDNLEEKRSLSDRFGLTLVYPAPDKKTYLEVVFALAKEAKLKINAAALTSMALEWEVRHGGRSGRTARQFIDYLLGKEIGKK